MAGVCFLMRQYGGGMGGLLADDMGLGKTIQVRRPRVQGGGTGRGLG